jgi:hypothetical protein
MIALGVNVLAIGDLAVNLAGLAHG